MRARCAHASNSPVPFVCYHGDRNVRARTECSADPRNRHSAAAIRPCEFATTSWRQIDPIDRHWCVRVGVGILHRRHDRALDRAINHTQLTEIYYVISGTATLLTGGTVTNANAIAADSDIVKIDVGQATRACLNAPHNGARSGLATSSSSPPASITGSMTSSAGSTTWRSGPTRITCCRRTTYTRRRNSFASRQSAVASR